MMSHDRLSPIYAAILNMSSYSFSIFSNSTKNCETIVNTEISMKKLELDIIRLERL